MPVKKIVIKRNLIDEVIQSLNLNVHDLHHMYPPPQVQGIGPGPVQKVLPVRSQDLVPAPENVKYIERQEADGEM